MQRVHKRAVKRRRVGLVLVAAFLSASCGSSQQGNRHGGSAGGSGKIGGSVGEGGRYLPGRNQCSSLQIVDGVATTEYRSVVLIARTEGSRITSRCTGTFVGPDTLITAAHCVSDAEDGGIVALLDNCQEGRTDLKEAGKAYDLGLNADEFKELEAASQQGEQIDTSEFAKDMAVVTFPEDIAPTTTPLSGIPARAGDEVTFVGFGRQYPPDHPQAGQQVSFTDITKRVGRNRLDSQSLTYMDGGGSLATFRTRGRQDEFETGDYATIAQGDSGGPLFIDGRLVAVVSSGQIGQVGDTRTDIGIFTRLLSSYGRSLLEKAREDGATFDGWEDYTAAAEP